MLHVFFDSLPLGLISNPAENADVIAITTWTRQHLLAGNKIYIPEVIDYEIRRELMRAQKINGIKKLDSLKLRFRYTPINSHAMNLAAALWAQARSRGTSTGDPKKLDIDVILAAQALTIGIATNELVVATGNTKHLAQFVPAQEWQNIKP